MARGGTRAGAGRKPKAIVYATESAAAEGQIVGALPKIIAKLIAMAEGGDVHAARYLVDRILGRVAILQAPPSMDRSMPYQQEDLDRDLVDRYIRGRHAEQWQERQLYELFPGTADKQGPLAPNSGGTGPGSMADREEKAPAKTVDQAVNARSETEETVEERDCAEEEGVDGDRITGPAETHSAVDVPAEQSGDGAASTDEVDRQPSPPSVHPDRGRWLPTWRHDPYNPRSGYG